MTHDLTWAQSFVFHAIKQRLVVAGPDQVARSVFDRFANKLPRRQCLDKNGVNPTAHSIDGISQQVVVLAQTDLTDVEKGMAYCQLVAIEDDFFRSFQRVFLTTIDRILLPFLETSVMVIVANLDRHRVVVLLDTTGNFLKQLFLKRFGMLQTSVNILVFSFEISNHIRVFALIEPIIVVNSGMAMHRHCMRMHRGNWWFWILYFIIFHYFTFYFTSKSSTSSFSKKRSKRSATP